MLLHVVSNTEHIPSAMDCTLLRTYSASLPIHAMLCDMLRYAILCIMLFPVATYYRVMVCYCVLATTKDARNGVTSAASLCYCISYVMIHDSSVSDGSRDGGTLHITWDAHRRRGGASVSLPTVLATGTYYTMHGRAYVVMLHIIA